MENPGRILQACLILLCGWITTANAACPDASDENSVTESPPDARLVVEDNGTAINHESGLMWKQCVQGKSGLDCSTGNAATFRWVEALNEARSEDFAGFDDWRLPKIDELRSIVDRCAEGPAIDPIAFPNAEGAEIWSASANLDYATNAWALDYATGEAVVGSRDDAKQVRLVRIQQ